MSCTFVGPCVYRDGDDCESLVDCDYWSPEKGGAMLIGLTGRARVGKDTAAEHLRFQHWFLPMAFADPIRDGLCVMFGLTPDRFREISKELTIDHLGLSPRQLMQRLGTEFGRHQVGETVWLDEAARRLARLADNHNRFAQDTPFRVVITDVRFDNEAQWVRDRGGRVIRICREGAPQVTGHVSEAGVRDDLVDCVVSNDGSYEEFYARLDGALAMLEGAGWAVA